MNRLTATAAAGAIALAAAVSSGAAADAVTAPAVVASSAAAYAASASSGYCSNFNGYSGAADFWRCTGTAASSQWVGSSCNPGEYNSGTYYNIYGAINLCGTRVWLHEYTYPTDTESGWSECVSSGEEAV